MHSHTDIMQFISCSHVTHPGNKPEFARALRDILDRSQAYNPVHDITSVLMTDGAMFAHVIEEPSPAVEALHSKIVRDKRHSRVLTLQYTLVHIRLFDLWPAAFLRVEVTPHTRTLDARSAPVELRQASISILKACRPILLSGAGGVVQNPAFLGYTRRAETAGL